MRFLLAIVSITAWAANIPVTVQTTTTRAVLRYTATSDSACTLAVLDGDGAAIADVNATLYTGSNLDSRTGNPNTGRRRVFVLGADPIAGAVAPVATDTSRYTRVLQADTAHSYTVTCGGDSGTGTFRTANIPLGATWLSSIPGDRLVPGEYAKPTINWSDSAVKYIDPTSGLAYKRLTAQGATVTWPSAASNSCSWVTVSKSGKVGRNCFIGNDLWWFSEDGTEGNNLGRTSTTLDDYYLNDIQCGSGGSLASHFDPNDADTWYCIASSYTALGFTFLKTQYFGDHAAGAAIPRIVKCDGGRTNQPCLEFTILTPVRGLKEELAAHSPASTNFMLYLTWNGIEKETGHFMIGTRESGQDSIGWQFALTLGDRSAFPSASGVRILGSRASHIVAPTSFCGIHTSGPPVNGWIPFGTSIIQGGSTAYTTTLNGALTATKVACPANSYGVTGDNCVAVVFAGTPLAGGQPLRDVGVGDAFIIDSEQFRIMTAASPTNFVAERAFAETTAASHSNGATVTMRCALRSGGWWDYLNDPTGASSTSVLFDANYGAHGGQWGDYNIYGTGTWYRIGEAKCPSGILGTNGQCYWTRPGKAPDMLTVDSLGQSMLPPFAGKVGCCHPNNLDTHLGPCSGEWCFDGRPFDNANSDASVMGTNAAPFTNVSGQLWLKAGGTTILNRKHLATFAASGSKVLIDVSSAATGNQISDAAGDSYKYCVALATNECRTGSTAGDVYVNAPNITSYPYCRYPGIAVQADSQIDICVGAVGSRMSTAVQFAVGTQDTWGRRQRALGAQFNSYRTQHVYWNSNSNPTQTTLSAYVRLIDGTDSPIMNAPLPPVPPRDSVNRGSFVPMRLSIGASASADNVVVQFGYDTNFYCTSRQEACVAVGSTVDEATPFYWASESYSGLACSAGCTVAIPAISRRVLYYRVIYRDAGGSTLATGPTQVTTIN